MTIANGLTVLRILLLPIFVGLFYLPLSWSPLLAAGMFLFLALTDWADGYLARRFSQETAVGAFLDPVADKLAVAMALTLLVGHYHVWWMTIPALVIIAREIVISALREWMALIGQHVHVRVSWLGKVKTLAQLCAITLLLLSLHPLPFWVRAMGQALLLVAMVLTLVSMLFYLRAAKIYEQM